MERGVGVASGHDGLASLVLIERMAGARAARPSRSSHCGSLRNL